MMSVHNTTDILCYIAYNWLCCSSSFVMHATRSQADAVVRCASGLCETEIGAVHSEQGPCTVAQSKMMLIYGVGTFLRYLSSASLCKKLAGMRSKLKGAALSLQA